MLPFQQTLISMALPRMEYREIVNKKTGEKLIGFADEDFEHADPIRYYKDFFVVQNMILREVPVDQIQGEAEITAESKEKFKAALRSWAEMATEIESTVVPENLLLLLDSKKKADQEKLLRGFALTPQLLIAFIFAAAKKGFTLSQFITQTPQKGVDLSKMPFAFEVRADDIKVFGKTELTDGQLRQALEHRKVVVAKFLERGDDWHCFFTTYKSLRGEETWQDEDQPHYHYISSAFGIPRDKVISELKSPKYKLGNLPHIKLEGYGVQPNS